MQIPEFMMTGCLLKNLVSYQNKYPQDIRGQQEHFGKLPGKHESFEEHLISTYSQQEREQLLDSLKQIEGD